MITFFGEADLIDWLKEQDLKTYGVALAPKGTRLKDGWLVGPYHVSGYLYDKETLSFPCSERFIVEISWSEEIDCKRSIRRIREAIE